MDLAINGSTTGDRTLEEDLAIAAEAGYVAVELRMPKVDAFLEKKHIRRSPRPSGKAFPAGVHN
ncbi:MAG: hypothetical protein LUG50_16155 [Planctomycetaceae bacterium]|nr:hypothetical protein [Planctomycetaceae bacterium]